MTTAKQLHAGLQVQDDRVADERRRLHIACAAARTRLVFSYPRVDAVESRPARAVVLRARNRARGAWAFARSAHVRGKGPPRRAIAPGLARAGRSARSHRRCGVRSGRAGAHFALDAEEARGAGHYLIDSQRLSGATRCARYARRNRNAWFAADGIVEPDAATRAVLATQRLAARSYSPSALQHFAACPYRFLLHAIHKLRPREEKVALEQMDPLTRGALFHEAQFRLFRELQAAQLLPMPSAKRRARHRNRRWGAGSRGRGECRKSWRPPFPACGAARSKICASICADGSSSAAADSGGWIPAHFEFSFGMEMRPE